MEGIFVLHFNGAPYVPNTSHHRNPKKQPKVYFTRSAAKIALSNMHISDDHIGAGKTWEIVEYAPKQEVTR